MDNNCVRSKGSNGWGRGFISFVRCTSSEENPELNIFQRSSIYSKSRNKSENGFLRQDTSLCTRANSRKIANARVFYPDNAHIQMHSLAYKPPFLASTTMHQGSNNRGADLFLGDIGTQKERDLSSDHQIRQGVLWRTVRSEHFFGLRRYAVAPLSFQRPTSCSRG